MNYMLVHSQCWTRFNDSTELLADGIWFGSLSGNASHSVVINT
jgi:hypothetical protein